MAIALKSYHLHQYTHHSSPHNTYFLLKNQNTIHIHRSCPISNISSHQLIFIVFSSSSKWRPINLRNFRKMGTNSGSFSFKGDGDEDDDVDDTDESVDQWFDILEDYIDSIWILKVFGSYGLMLPAIISSLLLVTGPKTFLMALAIPFGQSTLSFAVQRILNKDTKKRKKLRTKTKRGRRSRVYSSRKVRFEEDERIGVESWRKKKKAYPLWVERSDKSSGKGVKSASRTFGGWDELDGGKDPYVEYNSVREVQSSNESRKRDAEKGNSETLLLRLLVSVFPFLSYWIRLL